MIKQKKHYHMKLITTLSIVLIFIILSASRCKKDPVNPIDQLPPETKTGANTFGCLIDGKVFIPKGNPLGGPIKKASYQYLNNGFYFGISGIDKSNPEDVTDVGIRADSVILAIGTFSLTKYGAKGYLGGVGFSKIMQLSVEYYTNEIQSGQLVIKHFDTINQIVSGTFWFDAKNTNGQIVQVREGRFDMPFVR
jgi:hypothetical protein